MEKRNVIEPGRTPPEEDGGVKQASEEELEDHLMKRAASAAAEKLLENAERDVDAIETLSALGRR